MKTYIGNSGHGNHIGNSGHEVLYS